MSKRDNKKIQKRIEKALENTEEARQNILVKLERHHNDEVDDEKQLHLLVNYKLELLDVKLRLKDMLEHLHLIE